MIAVRVLSLLLCVQFRRIPTGFSTPKDLKLRSMLPGVQSAQSPNTAGPSVGGDSSDQLSRRTPHRLRPLRAPAQRFFGGQGAKLLVSLFGNRGFALSHIGVVQANSGGRPRNDPRAVRNGASKRSRVRSSASWPACTDGEEQRQVLRHSLGRGGVLCPTAFCYVSLGGLAIVALKRSCSP